MGGKCSMLRLKSEAHKLSLPARWAQQGNFSPGTEYLLFFRNQSNFGKGAVVQDIIADSSKSWFNTNYFPTVIAEKILDLDNLQSCVAKGLIINCIAHSCSVLLSLFPLSALTMIN